MTLLGLFRGLFDELFCPLAQLVPLGCDRGARRDEADTRHNDCQYRQALHDFASSTKVRNGSPARPN
jgi:hypothetical protein